MPQVDAKHISRMLERRPGPGRFREQLFWLVDMVFACKSTQDPKLHNHAGHVEEALGFLGDFIESGDEVALEDARHRIEVFASVVRDYVVEHESEM